MGHRKQVLHLAKVVAAMFFLPPYIVALTGATDILIEEEAGNGLGVKV